jgi:diguanylate cyclase (GGDEF)-like protein/PAS domain S-box-containing protein
MPGDAFRVLLEHAPDPLILVGPDDTIRFQSPAVEAVLGYAAADLARMPLLDLLRDDDREPGAMFLEAARTADVPPEPAEWQLVHREGQVLHVEAIGKALPYGGEPHVALSIRDITRRKSAESRLEHLAFHDPLTGLANRVLFCERVENALRARALDETPFAVLFLDLDDFKKVNDSLGHTAGDELLTEVAERLRSCIHADDTVARLGGDEFGILLENATTVPTAARVAERINDALRDAFVLEGTPVFIQASVGIALSDVADGGTELLRNADLAMYGAKHSGKGRHAAFDPRMHSVAMARLELESELRRAIERDEFVLHYQPIVELATGTVVGAEALLRWAHPERGLISPGEFVPLSEDSGLIVPLGRWVIREACRQAGVWRARFPEGSPFVSVNLSANQLREPTLPKQVAEAIRDARIEPQSLIMELTESVIMDDAPVTLQRLRALKELDVRLAIDDFGTGYSSLRYLHRFPVDILKIAHAFVDGLRDGSHEERFVSLIVDLCRALRIDALAEGVEQTSQAELLRGLGCKLGQGHHLAAPLDANELTRLLTEGRTLEAYVREVQGEAVVRERDWWSSVLGKTA